MGGGTPRPHPSAHISHTRVRIPPLPKAWAPSSLRVKGGAHTRAPPRPPEPTLHPNGDPPHTPPLPPVPPAGMDWGRWGCPSASLEAPPWGWGGGDARAYLGGGGTLGGARREAGTCRGGEWGCHLPGVSKGQLGPAATQSGGGWSRHRAAPGIFRFLAPPRPPPPHHPLLPAGNGHGWSSTAKVPRVGTVAPLSVGGFNATPPNGGGGDTQLCRPPPWGGWMQPGPVPPSPVIPPQKKIVTPTG